MLTQLCSQIGFGFVVLGAHGHVKASQGYQGGTKYVYSYQTSYALNAKQMVLNETNLELVQGVGKELKEVVEAKIEVQVIWINPENVEDKLLKLQVSPTLTIQHKIFSVK